MCKILFCYLGFVRFRSKITAVETLHVEFSRQESSVLKWLRPCAFTASNGASAVRGGCSVLSPVMALAFQLLETKQDMLPFPPIVT